VGPPEGWTIAGRQKEQKRAEKSRKEARPETGLPRAPEQKQVPGA